MSSDDKILTRTGGVEVVADRADDGTFEIRLERQPDGTSPTTEPVSVLDTGAWRAEPVTDTNATDRKPLVYALAGGMGVLAMVSVAILASSPNSLSGASPQTLEVDTAPTFRGFVVERHEPEHAKNVRFAFDTEELHDADTHGEDVEPSTVDFVDADAYEAGRRMAEAYSGGPVVAPAPEPDPGRDAALRRAEALDELERRLVEVREQREARQNEAMAPEAPPADDDDYYEEYEEDEYEEE